VQGKILPGEGGIEKYGTCGCLAEEKVPYRAKNTKGIRRTEFRRAGGHPPETRKRAYTSRADRCGGSLKTYQQDRVLHRKKRKRKKRRGKSERPLVQGR